MDGRANLSDSPATAIAEYQQDLPELGTLTTYEVSGATVLELRRFALGVDDAFYQQP